MPCPLGAGRRADIRLGNVREDVSVRSVITAWCRRVTGIIGRRGIARRVFVGSGMIFSGMIGSSVIRSSDRRRAARNRLPIVVISVIPDHLRSGGRFPGLVGPVVHHPAIRQQSADIDVGRIGHETVADADTRSLAAFEHGVEIGDDAFEHLDLRLDIARVGFGHRAGGVEHHHHIGVGEIELGLAGNLDRDLGEGKQPHDRSRHIDRGHAADRIIGLKRHDESAIGGAVGTIAEVDVEESIAVCGGGCGHQAIQHDRRAEFLARGQHTGVAGLLQPRFRKIAAPHIDAAADYGQQRNDRRRHNRQRVAGGVAQQRAQEVPACRLYRTFE